MVDVYTTISMVDAYTLISMVEPTKVDLAELHSGSHLIWIL